MFFFFKQKTESELWRCLKFRLVLFRSPGRARPPASSAAPPAAARPRSRPASPAPGTPRPPRRAPRAPTPGPSTRPLDALPDGRAHDARDLAARDDDALALELAAQELVELGATLLQRGGWAGGRVGGLLFRCSGDRPPDRRTAQHLLDLLSDPLQPREDLRREVAGGLGRRPTRPVLVRQAAADHRIHLSALPGQPG